MSYRQYLHVAGLLSFCCLWAWSSSASAGSGSLQLDEETRFEWYGYFRLDMAHDSAASSHGNYALYVKPHEGGKPTSTLNITARQTRVGLRVTRAKMRGRLEADFYGDSPENKNTLMLRYAYAEVPLGSLTLQAGQTSDLISPLVPMTVNYSVAWGAGNIGYRRPQLKLFRREVLYWGISLARNITGDLDGDTILDGEASGVPAVQGRVALTDLLGNSAIGLSAHYGRCGCPAKDVDYSNWSISSDARLQLSNEFAFLAEVYGGSNLGTYGGGIYNSDVLDGVHSRGGWVNLQCKLSDVSTASIGWGIDDVDEEDLLSVPDARIANSVAFAGAFHELTPGVTIGLELSRWWTKYGNVTVGMDDQPADLRLQTSFQGSF